MASPSCPLVPTYEIVPSDKLPLLDLSRSVGGELLRWAKRVLQCPGGHVVDSSEPRAQSHLERLLQDASTTLERQWIFRVAVSACVLGSLFGAIACVVPKAAGVVCAVLGLALVLPFTVLSFLLLRFDMFKLILTTYDFWFYSFVNTIGAVQLGASFPDARASVAAIVWLGNVHTIVVDANTRFICYLNLVSIGAVVLNTVVMIAMETKAIDAWLTRQVRLRATHEDFIATDNLISNALTTMTIIVLRNAYRRHKELLEQVKIGCPMLRCLNYRCRVKFSPADSKRLAEIRAFTPSQTIYYAPDYSHKFPVSQIYFLRFQGLIDASHTFFPVHLEPLVWSPPRTAAFLSLGCAGLGLTAAVFGLYPSPLVRPIAIVGLCCTMVFVGFALGLYHRSSTRAIMWSFDFAFLSLQLSFGFWGAGMLFNWDARAIALGSMWLWLHWAISIDAWTPLMHRKVGVNTKWLIVIVWLLFVVAQVCVTVEILWRDHWALTDSVVVSLFGRVHLRILPFFLSRLVMTFLMSLRLLWRAVTSGEEDAIVQIGRVCFKYTDTITQPSRAISAVAKAAKTVLRTAKRRSTLNGTNPSPAQVAPETAFTPE